MRLAVIGDPIAHSLSPGIHTAAMAALGIGGTYVGLRVPVERLAHVIGQTRRGEYDGLNITMPLKREAAALVDELTSDAAGARSVNTVVRGPGGRLTGHSTDVTALRRQWKVGELPADAATLILGAGGAAAAAVLAAPGPAIYVSARRPEAAAALAQGVGHGVVSVPWGVAVAEAVVVNATSLGMKGEELPETVLTLACGLIDMAYGPDTTPAVSTARHLGLPAVDGIDVLVAQAGDSLRLWTGHEPPWEAMMAAARNP